MTKVEIELLTEMHDFIEKAKRGEREVLVCETQGLSGSMCKSMVQRNWFIMSECMGVRLCPKALVVKAFQMVSSAADCMEVSHVDC